MTNLVAPTEDAWRRLQATVKRVESMPLSPTQFRRQMPYREGGTGGGGGDSGLTRDCGCGNCVKYGVITDCSVFDEAPQKIYFPNPHPDLFDGESIELEHVSGCTWESDTFDADLDGDEEDEEYFFRLVFSGTGPEDVVLSLEQV